MANQTGGNQRMVVRRDGRWAVVDVDAERASSLHDTQSQAEQRAKQIVSNLGGGEVRVQGRDGRWRDSDTVGGGNDPNPPRDRKH
jgi:hypothetical protein